MSPLEITAVGGSAVAIIGAGAAGIVTVLKAVKELRTDVAANTVTTNATAIEMAVVKAQTDGIGKQLEDAARAKGDLQGRAAQTAEQNAAAVAAIPPVTLTQDPQEVKIVNTPDDRVPVDHLPDKRQVTSKDIPNGK